MDNFAWIVVVFSLSLPFGSVLPAQHPLCILYCLEVNCYICVQCVSKGEKKVTPTPFFKEAPSSRRRRNARYPSPSLPSSSPFLFSPSHISSSPSSPLLPENCCVRDIPSGLVFASSPSSVMPLLILLFREVHCCFLRPLLEQRSERAIFRCVFPRKKTWR